MEKEIEFDKVCQENKEQNKWPDCFGIVYGNLFKKKAKPMFMKLMKKGYVVCPPSERSAKVLHGIFAMTEAGDKKKKKENFPRNIGNREYIFDSENTSKKSHSKRWVKKLNRGKTVEAQQKIPSCRNRNTIFDRVSGQIC